MHHLLSLLLVIIGLHVSIQTRIKSVLTVPNGEWRGAWDEKMCESGTYAIGFRLNVAEPSSPGRKDDTVLNGIHLHCISPSGVLSGLVWSRIGSSSHHRRNGFCPCSFLSAFQLRFGDGMTAVNNIRFNCVREQPVPVGYVRGTGEWSGWSKRCEGTGICGVSTLKENNVLRNVRMYCCY